MTLSPLIALVNTLYNILALEIDPINSIDHEQANGDMGK
jgi:hypothetical protein